MSSQLRVVKEYIAGEVFYLDRTKEHMKFGTISPFIRTGLLRVPTVPEFIILGRMWDKGIWGLVLLFLLHQFQ